MLIFDRSPNHRHPQAGAASTHGLFGVERFKYSIDICCSNTNSGIRDRQGDVISFFNVIIALDRFVDISVTTPNRNHATFRHGLGGIGYQIHYRF